MGFGSPSSLRQSLFFVDLLLKNYDTNETYNEDWYRNQKAMNHCKSPYKSPSKSCSNKLRCGISVAISALNSTIF